MSTVEGNSLSIARLKELARSPEASQQHVIAVVLTLQDEDEEVRAWACDALEEVNPTQESAAQLAELARHVNPTIAGWSCKLLGRLAEAATPYQAAIANTLSAHASSGARQMAALALQTIPDLSKETLNALRAAAQANDARLSRLAQQAIEAQGKSLA